MTGFRDEDLTCNAFLGGAVQLWQPKRGYRAGVDPVLLAAVVNAKPGQQVLELGCGAGQVLLCLAARVSGLDLTGVELQADYADLARRNAAENEVAIAVKNADLSALPSELRQKRFHHVLANPPYYQKGRHSSAADAGRATALGEETALDLWFEVAAKRLIPKGYLHMIQRADRLPEMLAGCTGRLGSVEVLPLAARTGKAPDLVILRARKEGKAPFRLHAPLILHTGTQHERDADSYVPEIASVLRQGAALNWPNA